MFSPKKIMYEVRKFFILRVRKIEVLTKSSILNLGIAILADTTYPLSLHAENG
jgi:hypothetical protein